MDELLARVVTEGGFNLKYIKDHVLPSWWDDDLGESEQGFLEACGHLARGLDLKIRPLADRMAVVFNAMPPALYKKADSKTDGDVVGSARIAATAARLALEGLDSPYLPPLSDGAAIRAAIIGRGAPYVGLQEILDYCWSLGIPVVYIGQSTGKRKMDAAAVMLDGRPAIIVAKKEKHRSKVAFLVAHELGHIALNHFEGAAVIADEDVKDESTEVQEHEANEFAVSLLTGHPKRKFTTETWYDGSGLYERALVASDKYHVDPGVIIANYSFGLAKDSRPGFSPWPLCEAALKLVGHDDAPQILEQWMTEQIALTDMRRSSREMLLRMTGATQAA